MCASDDDNEEENQKIDDEVKIIRQTESSTGTNFKSTHHTRVTYFLYSISRFELHHGIQHVHLCLQ
jgi:hypothetical protein